MPNDRLLFYAPALVGGGAERVWALVAAGLAARGWKVSFGVDFEAEANSGLLPPSMTRVVFGKGHCESVRSLARFLKAEQPAAVFSSVGASNLKLLLAKMWSRWKGAAVLSVHGRYQAESRFLGRFTYASTIFTSRLAARTIAVSEDLRRYLIGRFKARADKVITIHNAIYLPPADAVPAASELAARPDIVLAVGRLVPEKDYPTLFRAIAKAQRKPHLVVLGEGPERARLENLATELGIADRVALRGYITEPWSAYREAKLLALPSLTEAFGNVVVEALGHGLPVVATKCGGPEEILDRPGLGGLVPVGDATVMAAAIDTVLADPGDPAPRRTRAEDFSIDRALDRFEALLGDLGVHRA